MRLYVPDAWDPWLLTLACTVFLAATAYVIRDGWRAGWQEEEPEPEPEPVAAWVYEAPREVPIVRDTKTEVPSVAPDWRALNTQRPAGQHRWPEPNEETRRLRRD